MAILDPTTSTLNHNTDLTETKNDVYLIMGFDVSVNSEVIVKLDPPHGAVRAHFQSKVPQNGQYKYGLRFYVVPVGNHPADSDQAGPMMVGMTIIINDGGVPYTVSPENPIFITDSLGVVGP